MKRIFTWALCLMLALGCFSVLAEAAPKTYSGELTVPNRFTIKWIAPEDYELSDIDAGDPEWIGDTGFLLTALIPKDIESGKPMVNISIARDELLTGVARLNDLSDEALAQIEETFRDEDTVDISYMETEHGTKLMVVRETLDGTDYVDFYTIYMGYEIEMVLTQIEAMDKTPLTDEQIAMVVQFISDLEFIPLAEENNDVLCEIDNGAYVIRIPTAEGENAWHADAVHPDGAIKEITTAEMKDGCYEVRFVPEQDGESTVNVYHFNGYSCDQMFSFVLKAQDGAVLESTGGSYTASPAEEDQDPFISGEWLEKDTQFTNMTIAKNPEKGWDVEIVSPMTHEAYVFRATIYFDCADDAFIYDGGALYSLTADGEAAAEPDRDDLHGEIKPQGENEENLLLVWINEGSVEKNVVFERAVK